MKKKYHKKEQSNFTADPGPGTKASYKAKGYQGKNFYISSHAFERLHERNGWNRNTAIRMVEKVYENGTPEEDVKGYLSVWLKNKKNRKENQKIIVYGQDIYVFDGSSLITVYPILTKTSFIKRYSKK